MDRLRQYWVTSDVDGDGRGSRRADYGVEVVVAGKGILRIR